MATSPRPTRTTWSAWSATPARRYCSPPWARHGRRYSCFGTAWALGAAVALGVGGSFDVWAGVVKRAPAWAQKARVEWLYRLASDPRRLRRQLALPRFAAQVVRWSADDYGPPRRGRARHGPEQGPTR